MGCQSLFTKWNSIKVECTPLSREIPFSPQFHQTRRNQVARSSLYRTSFAILSSITGEESLQFRAFLSAGFEEKRCLESRLKTECSRVTVREGGNKTHGQDLKTFTAISASTCASFFRSSTPIVDHSTLATVVSAKGNRSRDSRYEDDNYLISCESCDTKVRT